MSFHFLMVTATPIIIIGDLAPLAFADVSDVPTFRIENYQLHKLFIKTNLM